MITKPQALGFSDGCQLQMYWGQVGRKSLFKEHWSVLARSMQISFLDFRIVGGSVSPKTQQPCSAGASWACALLTWFEAIQLCGCITRVWWCWMPFLISWAQWLDLGFLLWGCIPSMQIFYGRCFVRWKITSLWVFFQWDWNSRPLLDSISVVKYWDGFAFYWYPHFRIYLWDQELKWSYRLLITLPCKSQL